MESSQKESCLKTVTCNTVEGKEDSINATIKENPDSIGGISGETPDNIGATSEDKTDSIGATSKEKSDNIGATSDKKTDSIGATSEEKSGTIGATGDNKTDSIDAISEEKSDTIGTTSEEISDNIGATSEEKTDNIGVTSEEKTDNIGVTSEDNPKCGLSTEQSSSVGGLEESQDNVSAEFDFPLDIQTPIVKWEEVLGMEKAKDAIKESVILPAKFPLLFKGFRRPWRGILLYGAPGVGKTMLVKAAANAAAADDVTFINAHACYLIPNVYNEPYKIMRLIFDTAVERTPSIIFMDEIDVLFGDPSGGITTRQARLRTELLCQLDQLGSSGGNVIAATNTPWLIDSDVRRRFEKRIYIPLPDTAVRVMMFKTNVKDIKNSLAEENFLELGEKSEGYTGADISCVVRDAMMEPIRRIQNSTHYRKVKGPSRANPGAIVDELLTPCSPGDPGAIEMSWTQIDVDKLLEPAVTMGDMLKALSKSKPSVSAEHLELHNKFTETWGHI